MHIDFTDIDSLVIEHVGHLLETEEGYEVDTDFEYLFGAEWRLIGIRAKGDRALEVASVLAKILQEVTA